MENILLATRFTYAKKKKGSISPSKLNQSVYHNVNDFLCSSLPILFVLETLLDVTIILWFCWLDYESCNKGSIS